MRNSRPANPGACDLPDGRHVLVLPFGLSLSSSARPNDDDDDDDHDDWKEDTGDGKEVPLHTARRLVQVRPSPSTRCVWPDDAVR